MHKFSWEFIKYINILFITIIINDFMYRQVRVINTNFFQDPDNVHKKK